MERVKLLCNIGKFKAGWGIEVEDGLARLWASQGKAIIGPPDQPLKKGNLENYNNCQPLTAAEILAKSKMAAPAPKTAAPPIVEVKPELAEKE